MLKHLRARVPVIAGLILIFIGIFMAGQFDWYYKMDHLDKLFHVIGGVIAGWFAFSLVQKEVTTASRWKQLLIVAGIATLIGVVWECAEYASNFTRQSLPLWYHFFHGGDLADTISDLAADISGATLFALWALWKGRS